MARRIVASLAAGVALLAPAGAHAYSWPLKPFDRPHPIRGGFGDPRFHVGADPIDRLAAFHFGVDIAAPDGTAVYAVTAGRVSRHGASVGVVARSGREFGYWHIQPVVWTGQHVRRHQFLGRILPGWGHVHFAERARGTYLNPLRRGALTPFRDRTRPTVASVQLYGPDRTVLGPSQVSGTIDVVADIWDTPPLTPPAPWQAARLAPAIVAWRLLRGTQVVYPWQITVDLRRELLPSSLYGWIYAPGTYENRGIRWGRYLFWVTHGLDTSQLGAGTYALQVEALDTRGNLGRNELDFTVAA